MLVAVLLHFSTIVGTDGNIFHKMKYKRVIELSVTHFQAFF